jgi:hypothetical protein
MRAITVAVLVVLSTVAFANDALENDGRNMVWTDPATAAAHNRSFGIQGEYLGVGQDGMRYGVQVRATDRLEYSRSTGAWFINQQLVGALYQASGKAPEDSGLPGLGREKDTKFVCAMGGGWHRTGTPRGDEVLIGMDEGPYFGKTQGKNVELYDSTDERGDEPIAILSRIERKSPALDAKPPERAIVLFDGGSTDAWINGRVENGLLSGNDIKTKQTFRDYQLHLEFRTPYILACRQEDRPQKSSLTQTQTSGGVFHQGRYETLIRDSFCRPSIHEVAGSSMIDACCAINRIAPRVDVCLPSLVWQTYDADFTAARFDGAGKLTQPARITSRLNGVIVHNNQELSKTSPNAPIQEITSDPRPLYVRNKDYPVYYRNIWIVPK